MVRYLGGIAARTRRTFSVERGRWEYARPKHVDEVSRYADAVLDGYDCHLVLWGRPSIDVEALMTSPGPGAAVHGPPAHGDVRRFPAGVVRAQVLAVLRAWGMPAEPASVTADVMVDTDLAGIDSHGLSMLPAYGQYLADGRMSVTALPQVVREGPATVLLDAQDGLGHPATVRAMDMAVAKAGTAGLGAVAVRRSHHFGAAGYYARMAADAGMIGMVTTTTRTRAVVPTRSSTPLLGTNPLAFAAPTTDPDRPFLLDMSTSAVAVNKVKVHSYLGKPLPEGWVVDADGAPVTDPAVAHILLQEQARGGLTPLGGTEPMPGHKGYGLAVMVQILAGALSGAIFAPEPGREGADEIGHFCLALDPAAFGDRDGFRGAVVDIVDTLRAHPSTSAQRPVLVPGDPEHSAREERTTHGIPVSRTLLDLLERLCVRDGASFLLGEAS